ncbi:MAG: type II toxin-antitoxin system RelE/ParE family toxin [Psychroflexus sp.]
MYNVVLLPFAKQDIKESASWYNSKQKGLGKSFTQDVRSKVLYIQENPNASVIRYDDVRCAVLDIFPFMIHYTIDEPQKTVVVLAIFHTSLNPNKWTER